MKNPSQPHLVRVVAQSGAPPLSYDEATKLFRPVERRKKERPQATAPKTQPSGGEIKSALAAIDPDLEYGYWLTIGMSLHSAFGGDLDGFDLWDTWSADGKKYPGSDELTRKWDSFGGKEDGVTLATLFKLANESGWKGQPAAEVFAAAPAIEPSPPGGGKSAIEIITASSIRPEPIAWLWSGWLACGKMHIIAGPPGTGKTTIAIALAAALSQPGATWPDGSPTPDGGVLMWSGEDSASDTLVPRFAVAGADLGRVHFIGSVQGDGTSRPFDPARDIAMLSDFLAASPDVKLLIIDPIMQAVAGDAHRSNDVRRGLQPLADLGERFSVAIIGISHFSKGTSGRDPLERVTGSLAFGAAARIVLAAVRVADDPDGKRLLARSKSNIGPDGSGFHYRLEQAPLPRHPAITASRVAWLGDVAGSAKDLLNEADGEEGVGRGAVGTAAFFLEDILKNGPVSAHEVKERAEAEGISEASLRRAKKQLRVAASKGGMKNGWVWHIPKNDAADHLPPSVESIFS
jgi:hypothetical protein